MSRNNTSGRGGERHKSGRHSHSTSGRMARHGGSGQVRRVSQGESSPLIGTVLELDVDTLALGGAGVARLPASLTAGLAAGLAQGATEGVTEVAPVDATGGPGMAVFVSGALPGSRVRARLTRMFRRHAEAVCEEVLVPSPEAVEPLCPHFGTAGDTCGGCLLQNLDPARQLVWKQRQILDALRRIGRVEPQKVLPAVAAPSVTAFRNKMEFAFQGAGDSLRLGLYSRGDPGRVLDLSCCVIFPAEGYALLDAVRSFCRTEGPEAGLSAFDRRTGQGLLRHLVLRHSVFEDAWLVQLITAHAPQDGPEAQAIRKLGEELLQRFPKLKGFVHAERDRADGLAQAERTLLALGASALTESLGQVRYSVSVDAFFQTCTGGAQVLYAALAELADLSPKDTVYDLYSGGGGIALYLAGFAGRVLGLEKNPSAIADAEANARLNGIDNCRFVRADLSGRESMPTKLPQGFETPDVAVVDPPREGLDAGLVDWLKQTRPGRLLYVSCNPATLARDAGMLSEAFALSAVQAVDLFPHTAHAECLALFVPK